MSGCGSDCGRFIFGWACLTRALTAASALALSALLCLGCGSSDPLNRKAIKGKVTVDGLPVPNGSVSFEPLKAGGVSSGAVITDGSYTLTREFGLPPGTYRVSITGDDGTNFGVSPGKLPGDEIMPERKQLVPASWNSESKQQVEVKNEGPFVFDFPISTKEK